MNNKWKKELSRVNADGMGGKVTPSVTPAKPTTTTKPTQPTTEEKTPAQSLAELIGGDYQANVDKSKDYLKQYENLGAFDIATDPNFGALYNQYKDHYSKQAKLAMDDAIGKASAMTGGYGNSYAQSLGNQMYNERMDEMNNVLPELYNIAYGQYKDNKNDLLNKADLYGGLAQQEYENYIIKLAAEAEPAKKDEPQITDDMRAVLSGLTTNKAISDQLNRWLAAGIITEEQGIALQGQYGKDEHNWKTNEQGKYVDADGNEILEDDLASQGVLDYVGMMGNPDGWASSYNGGYNWWGGMDRNAELIMPTGDKITVNDLLARLKEQGMDYWQARSIIMNLQKKLGIHD